MGGGYTELSGILMNVVFVLNKSLTVKLQINVFDINSKKTIYSVQSEPWTAIWHLANLYPCLRKAYPPHRSPFCHTTAFL